MPTLNITLTAGNVLDQDFTDATIDTLDKLLFVLFVNGAGLISKKNSNLAGGADDQVSIDDGVDYTVKLKASDTLKLPSANVTYKTYKIDANGNAVEHYSGTVTVNAASAVSVFNSDQCVSYRAKQKFSANDNFDVVLPAGARLEALVIKNTTGNTMSLNAGISALGTTILNGFAIAANGYQIAKNEDLGDTTWSDTVTKTIYINSEAWGGCELEIWMIYQIYK